MAVQGDPSQSDSAGANVSAEQCPDNPDLEEPLDWTSGQVMLPPCIVCGDKASGWHYGANTCEPCKQFFRRSVMRNKRYVCYQKGNCYILRNKRNCSYCRLMQCINVGMSKEGSTRGRYTLEKRNQNIQTVNTLEIQKKINENGSICQEDERIKERNNTIEELSNKFLNAMDIHRTSHMELSLQAEEKYLEARSLKSEVFGSMEPIPKDEYDLIFKSTGIDIDDRRKVMEHIVESIEKYSGRFRNFCEFIPGFKSLLPADKVKLFKTSFFDCYILLYAWHYNADDGTILHPLNEKLVFGKEYARNLTNYQEGHEYFWSIAERVQKLDLTLEERVISVSLCLMLSDADISAEGKEILHACADYLIEVLCHLCSISHDPKQHVIGKLISIICDCRKQEFRGYFKELNDVFNEAIWPGAKLDDILFKVGP